MEDLEALVMGMEGDAHGSVQCPEYVSKSNGHGTGVAEMDPVD